MTRRARRLLALAILPFAVTTSLLAQTPPPSHNAATAAPTTAFAFSAFLAQVARANLELAAQRFNVPIAEAQIAIARIFPDPTLSVGLASVDLSGHGSPTVTTVGLTVPIEFPTKRAARISAAESQRIAARADLDDYLRNLRATAADAYVDALSTRQVLDRKQRTLASLERLVGVNEQRLRTGDVGEIAVVQSRVEAQQFEGEVRGAVGEVRAADLALLLQLGSARPSMDSVLQVAGNLQVAPRQFDPASLIAHAQSQRPDVIARRFALDAAHERVRLARANRLIDVAVNVSWQHSTASGVEFGNTPAYDTLAATLSVPLPVSRIYRGELDAALASETQADAMLRGTELRAEVEVRQALARYDAAVARVNLYTTGLLGEADRVFEATLYQYQRGGATLLEVINAQRTVNDVYLAYYSALADHAKGLIAVEQAAGTWDVDL